MAAGISLRALAKKMDVSPAYLSQVELGKLPPPTLDRMKKIAETIGIPVAILIEMSHRPNPHTTLLLQKRQEMNKLIKMTVDIGLESKDVFEILDLMQKLGGSGFRKLMQYGAENLSDFKQPGSGKPSSGVLHSPMSRFPFWEMANPRLVFQKLKFTEKNDLLRFMLEKISAIHSTLDPDNAYENLVSNEAEESSGIGNGAAIPHLFVDDFERTVISIARIPEGIDFEAIDENPVYLVCLILSDPELQQNHLHLLAYFARKFQNPTLMDEILRANSKKSMLSMLFDRGDEKIH